MRFDGETQQKVNQENRPPGIVRFWLTIMGVLAVDQFSKYLVMDRLMLGESRPLIEQVFYLTYVHNPGAAFGILAGKAWFFLMCAALVIIVMTVYNAYYHPPGVAQLAMGLIVGGAIGNFIDRIRFNAVIDFFDLYWWPVFNVADMAIVSGGILLVFYLIIIDKSGVS